ncbi:Hcp family type VI secretion system effector [Photorhabdus thracensis]|uniref:Hcp family type VI secretion system effector n=1 Tax=Photorhabdus thracensis TaxID=230089 RepID=UPI001E458BC3|nr:Hcp family type VI secretion system effector [Photorhabdus thracensis]MCC8420778.1 Hcp family type VI secretion system effector [Photorhabdus thracensis]
MADMIYMTIKGKKQGLISAGCSSVDSIGNKYQANHFDQILVYSLSHAITRAQNVDHQPIVIQKPIDKSSPLLGVAISDNESLECSIDFYRTNSNGAQERYYNIKITGATITEISVLHPHSLNHNELPPQESISLKYTNITWNHLIAGTGGYSIWDDRIY